MLINFLTFIAVCYLIIAHIIYKVNSRTIKSDRYCWRYRLYLTKLRRNKQNNIKT